jgi:hypothetical protein
MKQFKPGDELTFKATLPKVWKSPKGELVTKEKGTSYPCTFVSYRGEKSAVVRFMRHGEVIDRMVRADRLTVLEQSK